VNWRSRAGERVEGKHKAEKAGRESGKGKRRVGGGEARGGKTATRHVGKL
jgi:hypothetical protein